MTKLRNIGYLWFGSKIRQGFAGGIISLTPPLSLSSLWISWAVNEGAKEGTQLLYWGEPAAPRPGGRWLPPGRGRQAPTRGLRAKTILKNIKMKKRHVGVSNEELQHALSRWFQPGPIFY